jgi:hypothetical protein
MSFLPMIVRYVSGVDNLHPFRLLPPSSSFFRINLGSGLYISTLHSWVVVGGTPYAVQV